MTATRFRDPSIAPGELVELTHGGARVLVVPARGGIAARWQVGEREIFYLDEETLRDPKKNIRGGAPVLFPSPGKLEGDTWSHLGAGGKLAQHGFARGSEFAIESLGDVSATLVLEDDAETQRNYPYAFRLALEYVLSPVALTLSATVTNRGDGAMPFAFGLHPYFATPDKSQVKIPLRPKRVFDNVKKEVRDFAGFDLAHGETDLHLLDVADAETSLELPGAAVTVSVDAVTPWRWVVWTLPEKPFVCLEPWSAPANALNTGDGLTVLPAGATFRAMISFSIAAL